MLKDTKAIMKYIIPAPLCCKKAFILSRTWFHKLIRRRKIAEEREVDAFLLAISYWWKEMKVSGRRLEEGAVAEGVRLFG